MGSHRSVGRRLAASAVVAIVAVGLFGVVSPALAGNRGTPGDLEASFHAGPMAFGVILSHPGAAAAVAAPRFNPPGRIGLFSEYQEYCAGQPLGFWVFWMTDDPGVFQEISDEFAIDGIGLAERRVVKAFAGVGNGYWMAEGIPVLGPVPVGLHEFAWTFSVPDGEGGTWTETWYYQVSILDCG